MMEQSGDGRRAQGRPYYQALCLRAYLDVCTVDSPHYDDRMQVVAELSNAGGGSSHANRLEWKCSMKTCSSKVQGRKIIGTRNERGFEAVILAAELPKTAALLPMVWLGAYEETRGCGLPRGRIALLASLTLLLHVVFEIPVRSVSIIAGVDYCRITSDE